MDHRASSIDKLLLGSICKGITFYHCFLVVVLDKGFLFYFLTSTESFHGLCWIPSYIWTKRSADDQETSRQGPAQ